MPRQWQLNPQTGHYWAYDNGGYYARVGNDVMTWAQYQASYPPANPALQPQGGGASVPRRFPAQAIDNGRNRGSSIPDGAAPGHYGPWPGQPAGASRGGPERQRSVTSGSAGFNPLDPTYVRREPKFFRRYRVFVIYWHENAGDEKTPSLHGITKDRKHGERIYSKNRRLIVITAFDRHCICVPIGTYNQQGVSKPGVVPSHHAIAYTKKNRGPSEFEQRSGADKKMQPAIQIVPDDPQDMLDPLSRLNYSELYTVQFNSKVKHLGQVHPHSCAAFDSSCRAVLYHRMFNASLQSTTLSMQGLRVARATAQASVGGVQGESSTAARNSGRVEEEEEEADDGPEEESEEEDADDGAEEESEEEDSDE